jgi:uncharacterized protein GlcG (DUF336 family)
VRTTSDQAGNLIGAAKAKAADIGMAVSVVVLHFAGHLNAFSRMDGAVLTATVLKGRVAGKDAIMG